MSWETVIGLEVHAQLNTQSKIFSGSATAYGAMPNTQANAIDMGLPGVLPVLNQEAVKKAIKFGLAVDAKITPESIFARKNYFYPDLPKGYQISQFELPVVGEGQLKVRLDDGTKVIGITRAHLEEDAGKSLHEDFQGQSGIDLNRAGTPLLEIVSEPDMRSAKEAVAYLKTLHALVTYLDICDGNMQEGSFRCDANVSVRKKGEEKFGTRAEIKNINSFRFVERAIEFEVERQIDVLESGGEVVQETRLFDASTNTTRSMRSKEEANDYRYFPCPDLLPLAVSADDIEQVRASLPELPEAKLERFKADFSLSDYDASQLTSSRELANYFEEAVKVGGDAKLVANWLLSELLAHLNKANLSMAECPVSAETLGTLVKRIKDGTISGKIAKQLFEHVWEQEGSVDELIEKKGLKQISNPDEVRAQVESIIAQFPQQLADYRGGKDKLFGFFVGQVMKATKGKASPELVNQLLKELL